MKPKTEFVQLYNSLVCGIIHDQVRGRLLREADLTLEKAIDICCANEITSSQVRALTEERDVNRIRIVRSKDNKVKSQHRKS